MIPDPVASRLDEIVRALRVALRESPDAAFVLDLEGLFLMANRTLCASLRVEERELMGRRFALAARSTDPERILSNFHAALSGSPSRYRGSGTRPNGEPFVAEVTLLPIRVDGVVLAVLGTAVDLTEADRHDVEARRGEELVRLAGRIAQFGGWSVDAETRMVVLSEGARRMLGLPDDVTDLTADAWAMHPDESREGVSGLLERCLTDGEPFDFETVMVTASGERLTVRTLGEADVLADGTIVGAHGAIWNVSDTVAARERERELESRLSATLTSISDGVYFLDGEDRLSYANPRAREMLRFDEEQLRSTPLWALFPEAVDAGYRDAFDRARASGERVMHRAYYEPFDRWFETTAYPAGDGLAVYVRDVTLDERARETVRRTQKQLAQQAALLDRASDAMLLRELDGTVTYWNAAAATLYGWAAEEAVGRSVFELIGVEAEARTAALGELMRTGTFLGELEERTRDGRTVIVDCRWQLLYDENGEPQSIFAVNTDITDYRREQDARSRAQRLESLGTLAGGIAHDLNNMLTPVLMAVQMLELDEQDPFRRELLSTMETSVKRGADMIKQVLSFARGVDGQRVAVDIDALLDELVAFARDVLPKSVTVEVERADELPATIGDPTQLLQVLVNLVTNAKDAMDGAGHLRISACTLEVDDDYLSVSHAPAPGRYITVAVEDDGHGMPAAVIEKIFEPFYTTKTQGKGTGLGLATSLAIVRSHGGFMQVYSEPDRGTRFMVGLPESRVETDGTVAAPASRTALPHGNNELVLVVDDEESIRRVTTRTLEAHGYRTISAADGRAAIDLIENGGQTVDLVLTDMMMPVMDGAATSAYLEEHHPDIPIIASSGLTSGSSESRAVGMGIARFLAKPYTTGQLLRAVHDTLREYRSNDEETE